MCGHAPSFLPIVLSVYYNTNPYHFRKLALHHSRGKKSMDEAEAEVAELSVDEEPSSVAEEDDCDDEPVDSLIEEVQREEVERESNGLATEEAAARADSDQELDELLDGKAASSESCINYLCIFTCAINVRAESLGEFGKLLTQDKPLQAAQSVTSDPTSGSSASSGAGPPTSSSGDSFEEIFSEEFAAEAEAQLNEAMEMLASENPELWQQFESFAKSMGMETAAGGGASTSQATPTTNGAASASKEDTSVDEGASKERGGAPDLDAQLEETLKRLRETTEQIEVRIAEEERVRRGGERQTEMMCLLSCSKVALDLVWETCLVSWTLAQRKGKTS